MKVNMYLTNYEQKKGLKINHPDLAGCRVAKNRKF